MTDDTTENVFRQLQRWQDDADLASLTHFDPWTLCRVSLLPEWTLTLAAELGLAGPEEVPALVDQLASADLIEQRGDLTDGGRMASFWVRARRRREIGDYLRERLGSELLSQYLVLCGQVGNLDRPELEPWLAVRRFAADPTGHLLMHRINELIRDDLPKAITTVATAQVVSDVLGGTLEDAVRRARWRLDREYRTRDDLAHLEGYHRRAEIEDVLAELVTGEERWAVHLLGHAGVGKTMTVRHLASGALAADRGMDRFPVARVDFDHLDPRYPERRPADLLVAMTDELLGFATTRAAEHSYRAIRDAADALHEELSRSTPDSTTVENLRHDVVERFADLVAQLPAPVVLVLDTCEELAKLYPTGAPAPAIDHTFDLLERLHRRAPRVRVVLAGRRLLVKPSDGRPYGGPRLAERPYVRVEPMRGFSRADAEGYLDKQGVPPRQRPAVLARSTEGDRYNPFELAGLCDWIRDEPDLDLTHAVTADPYVERRILARVQDRHVKAALPVAVAFGEFDLELITPALTRAGVDVEAAFDGLSAQEWVNVRALGPDGRPSVIEIDEHIRERLRTAVASAPGVPTPDVTSLGRDAAEVIRRTSLPEVPTETVVAAIRLLPPEEAAELWADIDMRICRHREWAWPLQVAPRVAAMEQARSAAKGPSILAAVLATEASARLHNGHSDGLPLLWLSVTEHTDRHPDSAMATLLDIRGFLGQIMASQQKHEVLTRLLSDVQRGDLVYKAPPDSVLAMLEQVAPLDGWAEAALLIPLTTSLLTRKPARIKAGAAVLLAGFWLAGVYKRSVAAVLDDVIDDLALTLHLEDGDDRDPPDWPDWVAPPGLLTRLKLMRVLVALYGGEPLAEEDRRAWASKLARSGDIDTDRLRAALLDYELAFAVAGDLPKAHSTPLSGRPVPWLHHGFGRPFVIAIADELGLRGEHERAASVLTGHRKLAVGQGNQAETVEACDLGLLRLCRAARTTKYAPVLELAVEGSPRLRDEAWFVLIMVGRVADDRWLSPFGQLRFDPSGSPPLDMARRWAADHLDLWEAELLDEESDRSTLPAGGTLALGRGALMAGEIKTYLRQPLAASGLLLLAEERLAEAGDSEGAQRAHTLRFVDPAEEPAMPAWWERFVEVDDTSPRGLEHVRRQIRHWFAVRTPQQVLFIFTMIALIGGLPALSIKALGSGQVSWAFPILGAIAALYIAMIPVMYTLNFSIRRLVIRAEGSDLSLELYRSRGPHGIGRIPRRKRFNTPIWHQTRPLRSGLPDTLSGIEDRLKTVLPVRPTVVLLDIPLELRFLGPWERALSRAIPPGKVPRVIWVRRPPGRAPQIDLDDWRSRTKSFHGPVRFQPDAYRFPRPGPRQLVHVLGVPVRTTAGWQIRVRDTTGQAARDSSRGAGHREELVDLRELTREPVGLLVLQADPLGELPETLGSDRDGFVRAASSAVDLHADAVLVIPPLPDELAERVIKMIWSGIHRTAALSNFALFTMVTDLKTMIYKAGGRKANTAQSCLDVLLFLRSLEKGNS